MSAIVSSASATQLTFAIPPLITAQTQALYGLGKPKTISGTPFGDNNAAINFINDNNTNTIYNSSASVCYVGVDFGLNTAANISSINYMGNPSWAITSSKIAGAVFEGSNDKNTWTNIFTIDSSVHMGWNFWPNLNLDSVIYRYIRFRHNSTSNCQLAEISFVGQVYSTLPVNATGVTQCNITLILPKQTITVSSALI